MSNELIIPLNFAPPAAAFGGFNEDELGAGVQGGYAVVGYKGRLWSIKKGGATEPLLRENHDPMASIEVVIVRAATVISKIYYTGGYVEGSIAPPDCFSNNGVTPDAGVVRPQSQTCAVCPHNRFGSRITEAGKPGKACSDSKRLAVVPLEDMGNEVYGGPMLLRVPAASLQELPQYSAKLKQVGHTSFSVGTRIKFDLEVAYPKFLLSPVRALTEEEAEYVLALREDPRTLRILNESLEYDASIVPNGSTPEEQAEEDAYNQLVQAPPTAAPRAPAPAMRPVVQPAQPAQPAMQRAAPARPAPARPAVRQPVQAPAPAPRPAAQPSQPAAQQAPARAPARPAQQAVAPPATRVAPPSKPPVKAPAAPRPTPVQQTPVVSAQDNQDEAYDETQGEAESGTDFEADLDAQLNALLPDVA